MKLTINLKPTKVEARTRNECCSKINAIIGPSLSIVGDCCVPIKNNNVYAYSFQKKRSKRVTEYYKNGKVKKIYKTPTVYTGYVYKINLDLIKLLDLKIVRTKTGYRIER